MEKPKIVILNDNDEKLRQFCIAQSQVSESPRAQILQAEKLYNYIKTGINPYIP